MYKGKKGRPLGFKLSEATKRSISESKKGQRHKESTKNKISKALRNYFRRKHPLSGDIEYTYRRVTTSEIKRWLCDVSSELNDFRDVLSIRSMYNTLRMEVLYGDNIEEVFGHSITPELLLMAKEEYNNKVKENG